MIPESVVESIGAARLLPVVRVGSSDKAVTVVDRLAAAGLGVVELTATTPRWAAALETVRRDHPDLVVGVGTVVTAEVAEEAVDAGARFLVSPYPAPAVRAVAARLRVVFIEGGFTPGEVADAAQRGPAKLFPAHVGGPQFLRSLLSVLPGARVIPTGGIRLEQVPSWLEAGAFAVGVGSDLTAPGNLAARVRSLLDTARSPS